jgi:hypothetical protein
MRLDVVDLIEIVLLCALSGVRGKSTPRDQRVNAQQEKIKLNLALLRPGPRGTVRAGLLCHETQSAALETCGSAERLAHG